MSFQSNIYSSNIISISNIEYVIYNSNLFSSNIAASNITASNIVCSNFGYITMDNLSDFRFKTNIYNVDLTESYDAIRSIPLKRFQWKDLGLSSLTQTGWLAQDVESIIPAAVTTKNAYGLSDCKMLNMNELISHMYGAIQILQKKVEALENSQKKQ